MNGCLLLSLIINTGGEKEQVQTSEKAGRERETVSEGDREVGGVLCND